MVHSQSSKIIRSCDKPWLIKVRSLTELTIDFSKWNIIQIDGAKTKSNQDFYDEIAVKFNLPAYFGRNFDALYDCLLDFSWQEFDNYLIIFDKYEQLLANENSEKKRIVDNIFEEMVEFWNNPISAGMAWDRHGIPMKVIFVENQLNEY